MQAALRYLTAAALGAALATPAGAVTVYKCIDADGNTFYSDRCPPGSEKAQEKELRGGGGGDRRTSASDVAEQSPVTLYVAPECDACDLVRNLLRNRGIPFTEKNASTDVEAQNELKEVTGSMTVPAVTIAERVLTGYDKNALEGALDAAGYPSGEQEQPRSRDTSAASPPRGRAPERSPFPE